MPAYSQVYDNNNYDPAMPVAEIKLLSTKSEDRIALLMALIDSGADATMVPIDALETTDSLYHSTRRLRGITGQSIPVDTYFTVVQIGPYIIRGVKAVALPVGGEAIIGRDVLNQLELTLKGPAQELWIA